MLTKAFFIEIGTLSERATQARRAMMDHFCVLLGAIVEEARRRNPDVPSRPLPPMLAAAVVGGMTDVMIGALERDQYVESVDDLVETATDLLASVITGSSRPAPRRARRRRRRRASRCAKASQRHPQRAAWRVNAPPLRQAALDAARPQRRGRPARQDDREGGVARYSVSIAAIVASGPPVIANLVDDHPKQAQGADASAKSTETPVTATL